MKVLYSQLKKYLPALTADYKEIGKVFTMIGYMQDGPAIEVTYQGKTDYFIDLEVRQNRVDCLGVLGLARELSAYYNIPVEYPAYPSVEKYSNNDHRLDIHVNAKNAVKRVMAVSFSNIKIYESPAWLKEYLALYEINSINNLVDITNYVMLETAHASHVFDTDLVGEHLVWELNEGKYNSLKTLNGIELQLAADTIVISDGKRPLSLSFIGGGDDAVNNNTKNVLLEVAIYDGGLVRKNSRQLKTLTEAGSRVEKFLDPETIPYALEMLIALITEHCGATVSSSVFDNYVQKAEEKVMTIDLDKVQQLAGVYISYEDSQTYLRRLGFEIMDVALPKIQLKKPVNRLDIEQSEDVYEEIIRMYGYANIPKDTLNQTLVTDVTPSHLKLIDTLKDIAVKNGFDEVRSWAMVDETRNQDANYTESEAIRVTNAINDEVPILRQTIGVSLIGQAESMAKNFIDEILICEEGKVFNKGTNNYNEYYVFGGLGTGLQIEDMRQKVEQLLRQLGFEQISYVNSQKIPNTAHPKSCFDIQIDVNGTKSTVGILYKTNTTKAIDASIFELFIDRLSQIAASENVTKSTQEIDQKLVALDTNITLKTEESIQDYLIKALKNNRDKIWKWEVIDTYRKDSDTIKYTVRITYMHMNDSEAKEVHGKIEEHYTN